SPLEVMNATRVGTRPPLAPWGRVSTYAMTSPRGDQAGSAAERAVTIRRVFPSFADTIQSCGCSPGTAYTMRSLSGAQLMESTTSAFAARRAAPPSAFTPHSPREPPRSETKAIRVPSGENTGRSSIDAPEVKGRVSLPSAPAIHRLRFPERVELKAKRFPSG